MIIIKKIFVCVNLAANEFFHSLKSYVVIKICNKLKRVFMQNISCTSYKIETKGSLCYEHTVHNRLSLNLLVGVYVVGVYVVGVYVVGVYVVGVYVVGVYVVGVYVVGVYVVGVYVVGVYVVGVYVEHGHLAVSSVGTPLHTWSTEYFCPGHELTTETDLVLVVEAQSTHGVHEDHWVGSQVGLHEAKMK